MIYDNTNELLQNNRDDIVCFCVSSCGCLEFTRTLVKTARSANLPLILFALDSVTADKLKRECDVVLYNQNRRIDSSKYYRYGTNDFKDVVFQRYLIANELLRREKHIVYLDTDVVVKEDFRKDILSLHSRYPHADCLIQTNDLKNCCTGFFSIIPTQNSVGLFTTPFLNNNNHVKYDDDQHFFNRIIYDRNVLHIQFLDRETYPNGSYYYRNAARIDDICNIIHFNCVTGEQRKLNTMKKYGYH